ncbi:MAG: hypothetical protein HC858_02170 [Brachymonas sp.]|nr:hypothetical protein [Brachymonas sp.]
MDAILIAAGDAPGGLPNGKAAASEFAETDGGTTGGAVDGAPPPPPPHALNANATNKSKGLSLVANREGEIKKLIMIIKMQVMCKPRSDTISSITSDTQNC